MRLTVSRYYTPGGHAIQADGVHPDVAVEMKKNEASLSFREKDLEGHLAPESGAGPGSRPSGVVVLAGDAGSTPTEPSRSDARNIPDNPEDGSDAVLKVGWEVLHRAIAPQPAR
jgi:carboxyl-terminal processing protease